MYGVGPMLTRLLRRFDTCLGRGEFCPSMVGAGAPDGPIHLTKYNTVQAYLQMRSGGLVKCGCACDGSCGAPTELSWGGSEVEMERHRRSARVGGRGGRMASGGIMIH